MIEGKQSNQASPGTLFFLIGVLGLVFILFLSITSCGGGSSKANILPPDIQYMADTMFSRRRRMLTKEMDTLCMIRSEALISHLVDSLVLIEEESIKVISGNEE